MVGRLRRASTRLLPCGPVDLLRQLLLFGGAYWAYRIVRGAVESQVGPAFQHAREVIGWERSLHMFFEVDVQRWASQHAFLIHVADWLYLNSHFVVTTSFLVWLYLARNHAYYYVRNMFLVAMSLALIGYLFFPAAPPRFMPEWGFTDSVADFFGQNADKTAGVLYNPFAAVPSMHVAFALMVAVPAAKLSRHWLLKAAWALYPPLVTFVVIATGNHFWMDAAIGAAVAAVSAYAAALVLARARPDAWAWRTAHAEAAL